MKHRFTLIELLVECPIIAIFPLAVAGRAARLLSLRTAQRPNGNQSVFHKFSMEKFICQERNEKKSKNSNPKG